MPAITDTPATDRSSTHPEKLISLNLASMLGTWQNLGDHDPEHDREFRRCIHTARALVAARLARRCDPETWRQTP